MKYAKKMNDRGIRKYIVRITALIVMVCFTARDFVPAFPDNVRSDTDAVAQQTIFTCSDRNGSMARIAAKYLEELTEERFSDMSLAGVQRSLEYICNAGAVDLPFVKNTFRVTGSAEDGQVMVHVSDDLILRYYRSGELKSFSPIGTFKMIRQKPLNEYLNFQLLKRIAAKEMPREPEMTEQDAIASGGIEQLAAETRYYHKKDIFKPLIQMLLHFWPELIQGSSGGEIKRRAIKRVQDLLDDEGQKDHFERAVNYIHGSDLNGTRLDVEGPISVFAAEAGRKKKDLSIVRLTSDHALIYKNGSFFRTWNLLNARLKHAGWSSKKLTRLKRHIYSGILPVKILKGGMAIILPEKFLDKFNAAGPLVLIENPDDDLIELWSRKGIDKRGFFYSDLINKPEQAERVEDRLTGILPGYGFDFSTETKIRLAAEEINTNLLRHTRGKGGLFSIRTFRQNGIIVGVKLVGQGRGPGITDPDVLKKGGRLTRFSMAHEVVIESRGKRWKMIKPDVFEYEGSSDIKEGTRVNITVYGDDLFKVCEHAASKRDTEKPSGAMKGPASAALSADEENYIVKVYIEDTKRKPVEVADGQNIKEAITYINVHTPPFNNAKIDPARLKLFTVDIPGKSGMPRFPDAKRPSDFVYAYARLDRETLNVYVTRQYYESRLKDNKLALAEVIDHEYTEHVLKQPHRVAVSRARKFVPKNGFLSPFHYFYINALISREINKGYRAAEKLNPRRYASKAVIGAYTLNGSLNKGAIEKIDAYDKLYYRYLRVSEWLAAMKVAERLKKRDAVSEYSFKIKKSIDVEPRLKKYLEKGKDKYETIARRVLHVPEFEESKKVTAGPIHSTPFEEFRQYEEGTIFLGSKLFSAGALRVRGRGAIAYLNKYAEMDVDIAFTLKDGDIYRIWVLDKTGKIIDFSQMRQIYDENGERLVGVTLGKISKKILKQSGKKIIRGCRLNSLGELWLGGVKTDIGMNYADHMVEVKVEGTNVEYVSVLDEYGKEIKRVKFTFMYKENGKLIKSIYPAPKEHVLKKYKFITLKGLNLSEFGELYLGMATDPRSYFHNYGGSEIEVDLMYGHVYRVRIFDYENGRRYCVKEHVYSLISDKNKVIYSTNARWGQDSADRIIEEFKRSKAYKPARDRSIGENNVSIGEMIYYEKGEPPEKPSALKKNNMMKYKMRQSRLREKEAKRVREQYEAREKHDRRNRQSKMKRRENAAVEFAKYDGERELSSDIVKTILKDPDVSDTPEILSVEMKTGAFEERLVKEGCAVTGMINKKLMSEQARKRGIEIIEAHSKYPRSWMYAAKSNAKKFDAVLFVDARTDIDVNTVLKGIDLVLKESGKVYFIFEIDPENIDRIDDLASGELYFGMNTAMCLVSGTKEQATDAVTKAMEIMRRLKEKPARQENGAGVIKKMMVVLDSEISKVEELLNVGLASEEAATLFSELLKFAYNWQCDVTGSGFSKVSQNILEKCFVEMSRRIKRINDKNGFYVRVKNAAEEITVPVFDKRPTELIEQLIKKGSAELDGGKGNIVRARQYAAEAYKIDPTDPEVEKLFDRIEARECVEDAREAIRSKDFAQAYELLTDASNLRSNDPAVVSLLRDVKGKIARQRKDIPRREQKKSEIGPGADPGNSAEKKMLKGFAESVLHDSRGISRPRVLLIGEAVSGMKDELIPKNCDVKTMGIKPTKFTMFGLHGKERIITADIRDQKFWNTLKGNVKFDVVVLGGVLNGLDLGYVFTQVKEVLNNGGWLYVLNINDFNKLISDNGRKIEICDIEERLVQRSYDISNEVYSFIGTTGHMWIGDNIIELISATTPESGRGEYVEDDDPGNGIVSAYEEDDAEISKNTGTVHMGEDEIVRVEDLKFRFYSDLPPDQKTEDLYALTKVMIDDAEQIGSSGRGVSFFRVLFDGVWSGINNEKKYYDDALISFYGDKPVAICSFRVISPLKTVNDVGIYVRKKYRKNGIAFNTQQFLCDHFKQKGMLELNIGDTDDGNIDCRVRETTQAQKLQKRFIRNNLNAIERITYYPGSGEQIIRGLTIDLKKYDLSSDLTTGGHFLSYDMRGREDVERTVVELFDNMTIIASRLSGIKDGMVAHGNVPIKGRGKFVLAINSDLVVDELKVPIEGLIKALKRRKEKNDLLGSWLKNIEIKYDPRMTSSDLLNSLESLNSKGEIPKENIAIITNEESRKVFDAFEGESIITGIKITEDMKLTKTAYYPLIDIILFTLMRTRVQTYDIGALVDFYKRMPNCEVLDDLDVETLLYAEDIHMDLRELKKTITIRLVPSAKQVIASDEIYANMIKCIKAV